MNVNPNYANYREKLKSTKGIVIPFLGVHLRDIVFADEGNPDVTEEGFINIEKIEVISNTLAIIQKYQDEINSNYKSFILDKTIEKQLEQFIVSPPDSADDVLYALSTDKEPIITSAITSTSQ